MNELAAAATPATYQDVLDAPEHVVAELIDGVLYMQARPMPPHDFSQSRLNMLLGPPFELGFDGPGGWWIRTEPEIHFGDPLRRVMVPDLAGWRRERMPQIPTTGRYTIRPDWVCEILSPSTERVDRTKKTQVYAEEGVKHLWIVDPRAKILEVYEAHGGAWTLITAHAEGVEAALPPFEDRLFPLGLLWPSAEPSIG